MEVEQERPAERSNIAGAPQVGRKSVNWARKREVLEDENLSVFAMGSIESSSSNITAPGREGAISPLDFAAATAGGLPAAGGGYGGPGGYGNAGGVSAVPSSAWGGGTEGGESTYSTVFESPSKVGLSARQRAMMDAAAVGQFRFARIPRPSGAGGGAALPSVYSSVPGGAVNVLNLEGGGGGGGGEPGRLGSPGLPGLSGREGQAGVGAGLNAFRVAEINVRPAVRAALGKLDDRAIKQLGSGLLLPLPGPKRVAVSKAAGGERGGRRWFVAIPVNAKGQAMEAEINDAELRHYTPFVGIDGDDHTAAALSPDQVLAALEAAAGTAATASDELFARLEHAMKRREALAARKARVAAEAARREAEEAARYVELLTGAGADGYGYGYSHSRAASPGPGPSGELPQPFAAFGTRSMSPGAGGVSLQRQATTLVRRHAAAAAPPPDPPFAFASERQRAKLEPVLGAWGVAQAADPQMAALGAFKEALLPPGHRPPPPDMKPFAPAAGESARVTEAQVARRLAQMGETGSPTLDIDFGPRLARPDFGVLYGCLRRLPPAALDLRSNAGLDSASAARLAPLLHPHYRCGLRRLDLSGCPALGDAGFAALAMNLAQNKMLQVLNLSGCGLGDGSLLGLDRCLALNTCLRELDLSANSFSSAGVAALCRGVLAVLKLLMPLDLDARHPNGHYCLNLEEPEHRKDALPAKLRWPEAIPTAGTLLVTVRNNASLDPALAPSPAAVMPSGGGDTHRSGAADSVPVAAATASGATAASGGTGPGGATARSGAGRLLGRLRYRSERADAAATLLSACPDLHRAPWALAQFAGFGPDDFAELLQLSLAPLLPVRTRVVNGWQDCCTGHMRLDLAQLSHRLLAVLLVQLATRGSGSSGWAVPQAAAPIEDLLGAATARLGDATACMRGITFGGAPLGHSVIYLSSANIPTSGLLDLHYVNVRPRRHVQYVGMGLGKQRRTVTTGGTSIGPSRMSTADRSSNNGAAAATASGLSASLASGSTTAAPSGAASAAVSFLRRPGGGGGGEPRPPVAVGAGVVAVEALRMAASFLSPSLALNAQIGKKNWWQQYLVAWEGLYQEALLRLGLQHNAAGLAGWRHAGSMWKVSLSTYQAPPLEAPRLLIRPRGFTPGPHTGDELLLKAAACLGWRALALPWATPGSLAGRTLHFHMGAIDQLQAVAALCRFNDRCFKSIGQQVVTGLACDGAPQDVDEAEGLPGGLWQLILSRTVLCLDRPEFGTVSLQLGNITTEAQRAVAAVSIQAAEARAGANAWRRLR
eukprot:XP_001695630.1 predicted protein [Chlamydomonas reinhardtii]